MSAPNHNGYLLLFRSDEWYKQLSHEEIQRVMSQAKTWVDRLAAQGKVKGGLVLAREGAVISGKNSRVVSDGPFAESKEAIGGTLVLDAGTLEEAIAIAKTSPSLAHNITIEVRPIGDECPLEVRVRQLQQLGQLATADA